MMSNKKKKAGNEGEDLAAEFLIKKGYKIVERNYRFGKGEIDIVAKEGDTLVFVEVKTRKSLEYGPPELSITKSKERQVRKIAEAYLYDKEINNADCRIDVIAVLMLSPKEPDINHIKNAF